MGVDVPAIAVTQKDIGAVGGAEESWSDDGMTIDTVRAMLVEKAVLLSIYPLMRDP